MCDINRLLCGSISVVFVALHTWLKTNAAINLRATWSWPPVVMFPSENDTYLIVTKQADRGEREN